MATRSRSPKFPCPKCEGHAVARTSEIMSRTLKRIYYQCTNPKCGHTWRSRLEFEGTINPGMIDDSTLPPHRRLKRLDPKEIFEPET